MTKRTKKKVKRKAPKRNQQGDGIFGDIAKGFKKANKFLRKHKVISKSGKALDIFGVPYAGKVGNIAGQYGYGQYGGCSMCQQTGGNIGAGYVLPNKRRPLAVGRGSVVF